MKSGDGVGSGSAALSSASAPAAVDVGASTVEKCPSTEEGVGMRKRLRKAAPEQPTDASGSTTRTFAEKGKGVVELEEVPERGGLHFISVLIDRVRDVGRLIRSQHEKILTLWAANKELKLGANQELVATAEHRVKEQADKAGKAQNELEFLRNQWKELEQEVGVLHSSLDGAPNDRARLEGDVLSLTKAVAFLEVELKVEGLKAVATYKASRGFESGLEKMGRVSYEFRYRMVLKRLQGKHPEIMIEQDPFVECPDDAKVEMDLNQPFDDSTPS
ncbi:hypothetical protein BHE74_00040014 [Ensete ventricosum]|nr:hypothetical protein BHE74_00040014 [Ensete ventricosum]